MQEYLGKKGNYNYIISMDYDECRVFDSFGNCTKEMSALLAVSEVSFKKKINIVSILGTTLSEHTEVYYKGKVTVLHENHIEVFSRLFNAVTKADHLVYRISRKNVKQIIFLLPEGKYSELEIGNVLGVNEWSELPLKE